MRCLTLVLTRKWGQKILVGDDVVITVVHIEPGKVRLGIQAPPDVPIWRAEIAPPDHPAAAPRPEEPK